MEELVEGECDFVGLGDSVEHESVACVEWETLWRLKEAIPRSITMNPGINTGSEEFVLTLNC